MARSALPIAVVIASCVIASPVGARADEGPPGAASEPSPAERLFAEGRELLGRGEIEAACARFDESHTLMPAATGPLVNLAVCNEQLGRLATASRFYREVVERTRATQPDRAAFATQRLAEVEPKLSTVRVVVPDDERRSGLAITLDGAALDEHAWNTDVPVDGGEHRVDATAPDATPFHARVTVQRERGHADVAIALASPEKRRTTAFIVGGAGAVALAIGVGVGVSVAVECGGFFKDVCDGANRYPTAEERHRALSDERTKAWVADVAIGMGAAALAAGAYLLFTTPKATSAALRVVPLARGGGVGLDARF